MIAPLARPAVRSYLRLRGTGAPHHLRAITLPVPPPTAGIARIPAAQQLATFLADQPGCLMLSTRVDGAGHPVVISAWATAAQADRALRTAGLTGVAALHDIATVGAEHLPGQEAAGL